MHVPKIKNNRTTRHVAQSLEGWRNRCQGTMASKGQSPRYAQQSPRVISGFAIAAGGVTPVKQTLPELQMYYNQNLDKKTTKKILSWFLDNYGPSRTSAFLEELKSVGFHYATEAGISLGFDDLKIPPRKNFILDQAENQIAHTERFYRHGRMTAIERYQAVIDIWTTASEKLKEEVIAHFQLTDLFNPLYMMAFSGARGNISQVRQLVGMRGLMSDSAGGIIDFPIRKNFREGLTITEYVISCYGARKGLIDTALRTADSGYLTRRLVDVAHGIMIGTMDCGTKEAFTIYALKAPDSNLVMQSLEKRILGRVCANTNEEISPALAYEIVRGKRKLSTDIGSERQSTNTGAGEGRSPRVGFATAEQGQSPRYAEVGPTQSVATLRLGSASDSILSQKLPSSLDIRSPLTCKTSIIDVGHTEDICQLCYGWSLAHGRLVSLGEAVGILAAQSIGEPGTQLTMRTFHTGGIFAGGTDAKLFAPHDGIVSFASIANFLGGTESLRRGDAYAQASPLQSHGSSALQGKKIRTSLGQTAFFSFEKIQLKITSSDGGIAAQDLPLGRKQESYLSVPSYSLLFVYPGQHIEKNSLCAEISYLMQAKASLADSAGGGFAASQSRDRERRSLRVDSAAIAPQEHGRSPRYAEAKPTLSGTSQSRGEARATLSEARATGPRAGFTSTRTTIKPPKPSQDTHETNTSRTNEVPTMTKKVLSDIEGQVYFHRIAERRQKTGVEDIRHVKGVGSLWILNGSLTSTQGCSQCGDFFLGAGGQKRKVRHQSKAQAWAPPLQSEVQAWAPPLQSVAQASQSVAQASPQQSHQASNSRARLRFAQLDGWHEDIIAFQKSKNRIRSLRGLPTCESKPSQSNTVGVAGVRRAGIKSNNLEVFCVFWSNQIVNSSSSDFQQLSDRSYVLEVGFGSRGRGEARGQAWAPVAPLCEAPLQSRGEACATITPQPERSYALRSHQGRSPRLHSAAKATLYGSFSRLAIRARAILEPQKRVRYDLGTRGEARATGPRVSFASSYASITPAPYRQISPNLARSREIVPDLERFGELRGKYISEINNSSEEVNVLEWGIAQSLQGNTAPLSAESFGFIQETRNFDGVSEALVEKASSDCAQACAPVAPLCEAPLGAKPTSRGSAMAFVQQSSRGKMLSPGRITSIRSSYMNSLCLHKKHLRQYWLDGIQLPIGRAAKLRSAVANGVMASGLTASGVIAEPQAIAPHAIAPTPALLERGPNIVSSTKTKIPVQVKLGDALHGDSLAQVILKVLSCRNVSAFWKSLGSRRRLVSPDGTKITSPTRGNAYADGSYAQSLRSSAAEGSGRNGLWRNGEATGHYATGHYATYDTPPCKAVQLVVRKIHPYVLSNEASLLVHQGEGVSRRQILCELFFEKSKTGDIVQGLPKIEQLFEARRTSTHVQDAIHLRLKSNFIEASKLYSQVEAAGQAIRSIQRILVDEIQMVYQSQGVDISDKHIEIIVRQMTSKVIILDSEPRPVTHAQSLQSGATRPRLRSAAEGSFSVDDTRGLNNSSLSLPFYADDIIEYSDVVRALTSVVNTSKSNLLGREGWPVAPLGEARGPSSRAGLARQSHRSYAHTYPQASQSGAQASQSGAQASQSGAQASQSGATQSYRSPVLPEFEPIVLGITKRAFLSESWASSASFQEAKKVLMESACESKIDFLSGLKSNLIVGRYIRAGTSFRK